MHAEYESSTHTRSSRDKKKKRRQSGGRGRPFQKPLPAVCVHTTLVALAVQRPFLKAALFGVAEESQIEMQKYCKTLFSGEGFKDWNF